MKAKPPQIKKPITRRLFFKANEYAITAPLLNRKLIKILESLALGVDP
jgi:hypothetical protein